MENAIFEEKKVSKAYMKLSLPLVLSMTVSLIYNLADTFFVAQTQNTNIVAGVSLCAPLFTTLMALGNIFGQGGSYILACDIWARFSMLSTKFHTAGDSHMQAIAASLMGPEDVVVFVSYSGATRDMMDTLHLVRKNGAKVILLTHYSDAPGAALADVVLLCGAKESPLDSGSMPVKLAVLFVANVLVLRYTLDNQELANLSLSRTSRALGSKLL